MAEATLCSCLNADDWKVINSALELAKEDITKTRKRVARAFGEVPGAMSAKETIKGQLDAMEIQIDDAITRLAATPKCGEPAGKTTKLPPVMEHKGTKELQKESREKLKKEAPPAAPKETKTAKKKAATKKET